MPIPQADEIVTQQHKRYFFQQNGAAPENGLLYAGQDGQYLVIENATIPHGDITPINVGDPSQFKKYKQVGDEAAAPDFPTFTVNFLQNHSGIPRSLYTIAECMTTFYELTGFCKDPTILSRKVTDYVKILSNAKSTQTTAGGSAFDSDTMVQDDLDFTALGGVYPVGSLGVGEKAAAEIASEVIDVVYGNNVQCGNCGPNDDGTQLIYGVINNTIASPGIGPSVIYSIDGGLTWTVVSINGAVSGDTPKAIDIVGQNLVVLFSDATTGGYFTSVLNSITGIPGTWTKTTTGFVSGNQPNDMWVANPREVYFCGNGGYIYKSESILSGVTVLDAADTTTDNLNRIHGQDNVIVSVGDGAAIVYSTNRGDTFSVATNAPACFSIDALQVMDEFRWWVGCDNGNVFWTNTRAETAFTELTLPAATAGAIATIQDITFPTDEVGYIQAATSDPTGVFFTTIDGGRNWEVGGANEFPTVDRINRLAYPIVPNRGVATNNLAFGGLAGNGTDGIIMLGIATIK